LAAWYKCGEIEAKREGQQETMHLPAFIARQTKTQTQPTIHFRSNLRLKWPSSSSAAAAAAAAARTPPLHAPRSSTNTTTSKYTNRIYVVILILKTGEVPEARRFLF
jgi:hypothetical protein